MYCKLLEMKLLVIVSFLLPHGSYALDAPPLIKDTSVIDAVAAYTSPRFSIWDVPRVAWGYDEDEEWRGYDDEDEEWHFVHSIMERIYGFYINDIPYAGRHVNDRTDPEKMSLDHSDVTLKYIQYGLLANMKIRNQICTAGMIAMTVCWTMVLFCAVISCCSNSGARRFVDDSLKEPLMRLNELEKLCIGKGLLHSPPPEISNGEIVEAGEAKAEPCVNPLNCTLSYV